MNQKRPSTGLNVTVSQFWFAWVSMAPPMPAIAAETAEDEQLRPAQSDADRLRRRLGVAHGRQHATQPPAAQVVGEHEGDEHDDQFVEVERHVAAEVEPEQGRPLDREPAGSALEQLGVEHESVDDQRQAEGRESEEQTLATQRGIAGEQAGADGGRHAPTSMATSTGRSQCVGGPSGEERPEAGDRRLPEREVAGEAGDADDRHEDHDEGEHDLGQPEVGRAEHERRQERRPRQ